MSHHKISIQIKVIKMNWLILCILLTALNPFIHGQEVAQKLDTYLQQLTTLDKFSGSVLIAKGDTVLLKQSYGFADRENKIPNKVDTPFKIASITKSFTAAAIMQLQEKKLLNVEDTLASHIQNVPAGNKITIHHLLTHSSGIPNYYTHFADIQDCTDIQEMVLVMGRWPLDFEPGSDYRYSNSGYLILAYIIEKVSGMSYADYIAQYIFKPLGMNNSGSGTPKNCAQGCVQELSGITKAPSTTAPLTLTGNGDLYSSVEDMYKWYQGLRTGKILSKKSLDLMRKPHMLTSKNSGRGHGYGWFVDELNGKKYVEYTGALRGFLSKHMHFIDDNISIIILTNFEDQDLFCQICDKIPEIVFNEANMEYSINTDELINRWQNYLNNIKDWKKLIKGVPPKECGCGFVYELSHISLTKDESFAIADMSNLLISEPHYHPELEIYFILKGTGLVVVGNTEYSVQKNSIVVIAPNIAHYTVPQKNLVMAVVNTPAFNAQNYVPLLEDNAQVQFSKIQFDSHAKNISSYFLSRISS